MRKTTGTGDPSRPTLNYFRQCQGCGKSIRYPLAVCNRLCRFRAKVKRQYGANK